MSGTEDKTKGTFHEIKGKAKEEVGRLTNSPELEIEGRDEKNAGKVRKKIGQIKKIFGK
ncbi:MAG: CsbD family protein [Acidobacteria bacterium]|nr:CsbD family protein [Acidobacteriota bacterium]